MRRRLSSATFPLHRHSLPQLVVDGTLVALAYYLAFELRFDNGVKGSYSQLYSRTWPWVVGGTAVILALARVYQRRWRYAGQRDYEALARAVVVATVALVGAVAILRPVHKVSHRVTSAVGLPNGVVALYFLITLLLLSGARLLARSIYERPIRARS